MTTTPDEEMLPHDGKGMPFDGDTLVTVRFADGDESDVPKRAVLAGDCWNARSNHLFANIVAYRIHDPKGDA